jgi:predicted dehydrogenase
MVRIGVLGASRIAPKAVVAPARVIPTAFLSRVAARDPARARAFAHEHGFAGHEKDYASLVASPEVDLVYNALSVDQHAPWSTRALEAGKHVLCEKPLAMNAGEAKRMIDAAAANGRRCIEAFHHRYHPAHVAVDRLLRAGTIGRIVSVRALFDALIRDTPDEIRQHKEFGGGAMMDLGCYPLAWILAAFDQSPEKIEAEATLTPRGVDKTMRVRLSFDGGAEATIETSMAAPVRARLETIGETGRIEFDSPVSPHVAGRLTLHRDGAPAENLPVSRISTYTYQLDAVLRALETGEALPTEGLAMLRQQRTLDAIYAAAGLTALRSMSKQ